MPMHRSSLRHSVYTVGAYGNPNGHVYGGPALRDPVNGAAANFGISPENEHFYCTALPYSYHVASPEPGLRQVSFKPPADGPDLAYYLPYLDNNITSLKLGDAADAFFTDNLSGCSIFVDRSTTGHLIVYHANRQGADYAPTAEQRRKLSFEREVAVAVKHVQHDAAVQSSYNGAVNQGSLFKSRYMADAAQHEAILRFGGQGDTTIYGTTVVGFRRAGAWLLWYQTWRCDATGHNYAVVRSEQFYP